MAKIDEQIRRLVDNVEPVGADEIRAGYKANRPWPTISVVAAAALLVAVGLAIVLTHHSNPTPTAIQTEPTPVSNPDVFVAVEGQNFSLDVRSVRTGAVIRTLAEQAGQVAMSPDGSTVYYQSGEPGNAGIYSVPIGGGTPRQIGTGSAPSVSPDSRKVAFALPGLTDVVAIYDVYDHTTQRIDLTRIIGAGAHLSNTGATLAWVSDSLLLVVPMQDATNVMSTNVISTIYRPHAVIVDLDHPNSVHAIDVTSYLPSVESIGGPGPIPGTVWVSTGNKMVLLLVTPTSITHLQTVAIPNMAVLGALSPDGREVLYVQNVTPPGADQQVLQYQEADLGSSGLTSPRLVFDNPQLEGSAW